MLQRNIEWAGKRAHVAHAAVVSLHAICCGMPILALMAAGVTGLTSGAAWASSWMGLHELLHAHELWIVAISALLVAVGGTLEALARRSATRPFPWLFAISVACFAINIAVILAHRAG